MAKKKKKPVRRPRVGGTGKLNPNNPIIKFGVPIAGFLLGDKIQAPIDKMVGTKLDGKIVGAAEAGLGAFLVLGKKKSLVKSIVGGLLVGAGAKKLATEFGIGGLGNVYGRVPVIGNTYGRVPVIGGAAKRINGSGGYTPNASLNGYSPNQSLSGRVMAGVSTGSGSMLSNQPGSNMMN